MPYGGPLFFTHYSFCGLDPRGLKDRYADYWDLNVRHVRINRAHCIANPGKHKGYGEACWGLTASDDPRRLLARMRPTTTTARSRRRPRWRACRMRPREVMQVLRHFLTRHGETPLERATASSMRSASGGAGTQTPSSPSTRARSS